ncbi:alanine dehydrogenase [Desulfonauticus submarinus]|uniref:Alanine dehydrogenase n=1 Tax=Desulfonauticus submarinus TaxID=206665 RepID=A0A1H0CW86_9BACT|nr:alanine dehydrogenase [Desulfonauticus submarinus]SDN62125.1 L-alanine dehydrogenase [Desulfonauticus submarinus]
MLIGCPKEIKNNEYRVGLTPASVKAYIQHGHKVLIESGAGLGSGIGDEEYVKVGATLVETAEEVWQKSEMIVKVKEPLPQEYPLMQEGQIVYTYFHFAADEELTKACLDKKIIAMAYETVQEPNGNLPLLKPMSEVAGRMAPLMAAFYLAKSQGGLGVLPTGVPGVLPANVVVIGGGTVGSNAARIAAGFGAKVTVLDINANTLEHLGNIMPSNVFTCFSDHVTLEASITEADIVIGAVLIPGAKAPKLITRELLNKMKPGAVFVDVAIDQGGCAETSRPTTHSDPIFIEENVVHYCVANMPGAYARTSTFALNNVTIKYGLKLADLGVEQACKQDSVLMKGLNMYKGILTCPPVGAAFGLEKECKLPSEIFH